MKKLVLFMHTTLDGFVAGPKGEMDWIKIDDEMFDYAGKRTNEADTALYGRITYQMMESYWPAAGEQSNATKHDIEHSQWYNKVEKVIVSKTMIDAELNNITVISNDIEDKIAQLKKNDGKDILMFGSPSVAHALMRGNLIDDYWLFVNPIILGEGISLFKGVKEKIQLKLESSMVFPSGVVCLHYQKNE
ncbi:dihydrofolate reductase family protein [Solitalea koreensis]|uniref:Dihydrofolate reductase n=1 Tax=Solitalea koreensis TaxID=543615 RepID=A0A521EI32_9SPHI|nr:dihydrofolate reductase family protein [Solitalea koreensis]SMO83573.1 Dihydrofolate reductase [Solitalea koreensis]